MEQKQTFISNSLKSRGIASSLLVFRVLPTAYGNSMQFAPRMAAEFSSKPDRKGPFSAFVCDRGQSSLVDKSAIIDSFFCVANSESIA